MDEYAKAAAEVLSETAPAEVNRVVVRGQAANDGYLIDLEYTIQPASESGSTRLVFDHLNCPLPIMQAESETVELFDLAPRTGQRLIALDGPPAGLPAQFQVALQLGWAADSEIPFVVLPDILPKPAQHDDTRGDYLSTDLFVGAGTEAVFQTAGVQLAAGGWNPRENRQRQIILVPREKVRLVTNDLLIMRLDRVSGDTRGEATIAEYVMRSRAFVSQVLGMNLDARVLAVIAQDVLSIPKPAGAVVYGDPSFFGLEGGVYHALSSQGTEMVAGMWWGGGVRMRGHVGAATALGIRHAVMLQQLVAESRQAHLAYFLDRARNIQPYAARDDASVEARGAGFAMDLALGLHQLLETKPHQVRVLAELTQRHWGTTVHPDLVLDALQTAGARLKHPVPRLDP
jgi:hypothetical protein